MPSGYDPMGGHRFSEKVMLRQNDILGRVHNDIRTI